MRHHVVRVLVRSRETAFALTRRPRRRLAHCIVFEKFLSRERVVPLVLAGRVILPAAPALTDAQKESALHAFKVRCVSVVMRSGVAHADTRIKVFEELLLAPDAALSWRLQKGAIFVAAIVCGSIHSMHADLLRALQVMQLYGTRSLEAGTFLRTDYAVRLPAAAKA